MEKKYKYLIILFTFFTLLQLFATVSQAQGTTYLVKIYVMDLSGEPIETAIVQIYRGTSLINQSVTNPLGKSSFYLEVGTYDIMVKKHGYKDSYTEKLISGATSVKIYLEAGSGSLEDDNSLIYFVFAVIGTFTAVFSTWVGYNAYKFQRKHHPSKYLKKIIEGKK